MGINNPGGGSGSVLQFARTFYVSSAFAGKSSPFFSTIQAAMNAADGNTNTVIYLGPGTYAEAITGKTNVAVVGISRDLCFIDRQQSATTFQMTLGGKTLTLQSVTIFGNTGAGSCALEVDGSAGGTLNIFDCNIISGISYGIRFTGVNSATLNVNIYNSFLQGTGTSGVGCLNFPGGGVTVGGVLWKIVNCTLVGNIYYSNNNFSDFGFDHCVIYGNPDIMQSNTSDITYRNCQFRNNGILLSANFGGTSTFYFQNCSFTAETIAATAGSTKAVFQNCSFITRGTDVAFMNLSGGGVIRMDGCYIQDGRIVFSYVGTGQLILTDCTIHNAGGTLCLDSGANVMTFTAMNVTSDKALGANITVAAGGVNNNFSKAI